MARPRVEVDIDGRRLDLSNLDKVLYPAAGFTKAQVIDYYTRVAPAMLPHLRGRPLTLKRYPNGVDASFFYEKQCPRHRPDWVRTVRVHARGTGRFGGQRREAREIDFCLAGDVPTLVWLANLACLEMHTLLARGEDVMAPTMVVFDLDPGAPADVLECARVALLLRDALQGLGLETVIKTSGSKGLQVYLPLNTPTTYKETRPFARAVAQLLEKEHGDLVVARMTKELRGGKVYVDWQQNDDFKTTVCAYSLRAREQPTASTPLSWDEVEAACEADDAGALRFAADEVLERVERRGDLFAPALELQQELPAL
ncbi:MAG: non-homologous end-joining DNA ligase [Actinomycetota bacterium]|nr:non-homologous end-joining DNA ligase [Actinomycetota bacterium]